MFTDQACSNLGFFDEMRGKKSVIKIKIISPWHILPKLFKALKQLGFFIYYNVKLGGGEGKHNSKSHSPSALS